MVVVDHLFRHATGIVCLAAFAVHSSQDLRAQNANLGAAGAYALLGLANGEVSVNSASTVTGDFGYSRGVVSDTNQKIGEGFVGQWTGTAYVHSQVARFRYAANYRPTGGIVTNATEDARLDRANADALGLSRTILALPVTQYIGPIVDQSVTIGGIDAQRTLHVIEVASLSMNSDVLHLIGDPDDVFVLNIVGDFRFSQSEVRLSGGVTPGHVLFHFSPNGRFTRNVLINKSSSIFRGTILAPDLGGYAVEYHNPASFRGAIIARRIVVHSDFNLTHDPFTEFVCECVPAVVNTNLPACGSTTDPVLTSTLPTIGRPVELSVASQFPHSLLFLVFDIAPANAWTLPGSNCTAWVDRQSLVIADVSLTDAVGGYSWSLGIPPRCKWLNVPLTFQAVIFTPQTAGPIPGLPIWLSNGAELTIGLHP